MDAQAPLTTPTPAEGPTAAQTMPPVQDDERFFSALGYFAFLFILSLIVKPQSAYCKFHAKQSMVLFLVTLLVLVILAALPQIGSLLTLALFALYVIAIYRAYSGDWWRIPLISAFTGKVDIEAMYKKAGAVAATGFDDMKEKAQELAQKAAEGAKNLGKQEDKPVDQTPQSPPEASASEK